MSLLRTWYLNKKFKEIDKWLIPAENELKENDIDKKIDLYNEAFRKAEHIFFYSMSGFWFIACAIVKYVICFALLFGFIKESAHSESFAILFSSIVVILYRQNDSNELYDRYRDVELQYLLNKTRLLHKGLKDMSKL